MRDFFNRHRRKFITAGVVSAGIYAAYSYATAKLREVSDRASDERTAKENLKRRFKQNQQDATFNVVAFMPELSEKILEALKVESITAELQAQKGGRSTTTGGSVAEDDTASMRSGYSEITHSTLGRRSKLDLWNDVKIISITRIFSLYYCISLLVIFTRIQLNLIGRGSYVASVMSVVNDDGEAKITLSDESLDGTSINSALNREYMTFVWYILNRGWEGVVNRVKEAVEEVFGRLEVREEITLSQIRLLTSRVRSIVEFNGAGDDHYNWLPHVLPSPEEELEVLRAGGQAVDEVSPELRSLLDESAMEMGSQESAVLISACVDLGLAELLENKLKSAFQGRPKLRVANVLPVMTREAHIVGGQQPNAYLNSINNLSELDGFSARLFTSFEIGVSAPSV